MKSKIAGCIGGMIVNKQVHLVLYHFSVFFKKNPSISSYCCLAALSFSCLSASAFGYNKYLLGIGNDDIFCYDLVWLFIFI